MRKDRDRNATVPKARISTLTARTETKTHRFTNPELKSLISDDQRTKQSNNERNVPSSGTKEFIRIDRQREIRSNGKAWKPSRDRSTRARVPNKRELIISQERFRLSVLNSREKYTRKSDQREEAVEKRTWLATSWPVCNTRGLARSRLYRLINKRLPLCLFPRLLGLPRRSALRETRGRIQNGAAERNCERTDRGIRMFVAARKRAAAPHRAAPTTKNTQPAAK